MQTGRAACWLLVIASVLLPCCAPARGDDVDVPRQRRIYVPVDELDTVLEHDKQGVILSRDEFQKLWTEARKRLEQMPSSAHKTLVSEADYVAQLQEHQLVLETTIRLEQFAAGWQSVVFAYRGLAVESALLDGKPAQLGRAPQEGRPLVVFTREPGRHVLKLRLAAPLVAAGSDKLAGFSLAPIATGTFQIELPPGKYLYADDIALERGAPAEQPARYTLAVGGKSALVLRITDRQARQTSASLVFAATAIGLHVAPEERTWRAVTSLSIFGKPIDSLSFSIPKSLEITAVESPGLDRWEINDDPGASKTTLKLVYRQPFSDPRNVTLSGVAASVLGEPWSVPTLTLKDATSHIARLLVQYPAGLRLQQLEATGIRRTAAEDAHVADMPGVPDMPVKVEAGQKLYYAAWHEDFVLSFVTRRRAGELQATIAARVDINSAELDLRSSIAVHTRFVPLFDFDIELPVDWSATDVLLENRPAAWRVVPLAAGSNVVRVTFNPPLPAGGKANLILSARLVPGENWPVEDQPFTFKLPEVFLPQVGVTDGRYMIAAGEDLELIPADVTGLDPLGLAEDEQRPVGAPRLAYEYQDTRFSGTLSVSRKTTRIAAETLAFHRLERETLYAHLEARLVVQGGGTQKVFVSLPESAGTNLRFGLIDPNPGQSVRPRITEQSSAPPADGRRVWALQLDRRAFGLLWLAVELTLPRSADAGSVLLPSLAVISADREDAFTAVEGGPDQELTIAAQDSTGQPLAEVDPADIPLPRGYVPHERVVAAYHAVRPGYRIGVSEARFEREPVPTAVCDRASLTSVLGQAGQEQHRADLLLRAVGIQSVRVELPGGADLWATLVDGNPVEVRALEGAAGELPVRLIAWPQTGDPATPHRIELLYRTAVATLESSGRLRQSPPRIAAVNGQGEVQPIVTLASDWQLYYPGQTEITASSGQFAALEKPSRESLLGQLHQGLSLISPSQLWQKCLIAGLVGAALWLFFYAYRKRGVFGSAAVALVGLVLAAGWVFVQFANQEFASREYAPATAAAKSDAKSHSGGFWVDSDSKDQYYVGAQPAPGPGAGMGGGFGGRMGPGAAPSSEPKGDLSRRIERNDEAMPLASEPEAATDARYGAIAGASRMEGDAALRVPQNAVGQGALAQGPGVVLQEQPAHEAPPADRGADEKSGAPARRWGARLSLAIDLPVPPDSRKTVFRYTGLPEAAAPPTLDIEYQSRRTANLISVAWQVGLLLVFWFTRKWSVGVRATLGVLGVLVPLALVPLVPVDALPSLDGLFLGSLWGLLLWGALAMSTRRKTNLASSNASKVLRVGAIALIAGGLAQAVLAQDAKVQPPAGEKTRAKVPTIVVPYESDQDPLKASRVLLPWDQFLELWNAAHPDQATVPAPVAGLVSEALYTARVVGAAGKKARVEVTGRLVLHSFREDQISLPLPFGGVALGSAELDGTEAAILPNDGAGGPGLAVVVTSRGFHVLDVKFSVPAEQTGPAGKFTLPLHAVPAGALRFVLPAADLNLRIAGTTATYRKVHDGEQTVAVVPVDQSGDVTVAWFPAQAREAAEGVVHVESTTTVSLGDAGLSLASSFKYTIRHGTVSEAVFSLPGGVLVRRIAGPDVGGWEPAGEPAARTLKVFLRRPVSDSTILQFDLFVPQAFAEQARSISIPQLAPQGVTRDSGTVGILFERQLSVSVGESSGLSQIDVSQFVPPQPFEQSAAPGAPAANPTQLAFRFASRSWQLKLLVARQQPQSKGVAEHAVFIASRRTRLASHLELHLTGAPRSEVSVQLPPGYLLYDLKANGVADYHVERGPGEQPGKAGAQLIIELSGPRTGTLELELEGVIPREPADYSPQIAVPVPLSVDELRSILAVWLDRSYTATLADLSDWKSIDPAELPERLRAARADPVQFALRSGRMAPQPVALALERAVPRLSADALAVVIVRETSLQYLLYLRWNIAAARENRFTFTSPDWLADRLEFERHAGGIRIREVHSEKIPGNRLRWTVTLEEPRERVATLLARATLPPPVAGQVPAPTVVFEQRVTGDTGLQIQKIEPQREYLVLVNQSPERLDLEARDAVEAVSAADLPIRISQKTSDQAAEILRVRDAAAPIGWRSQGAQRVKALPASVNLAKFTLVLAQDGSWKEEVEYRINNRSRQFLALRLSRGARILSLFVSGRPSRPIGAKREAEPDLILVPLPKTSAGDLSAQVKLVLAGRFDRALPHGVQVLRSEVDLPAPHVLSQTEDAAFGMPVAATEWTVVLPNEIDARRIDDANRSNLTETEAGAEELIEAYNERLKMFTTMLDETASINVRSRAANNLKQLGLATRKYSEVEQRLASKSEEGRQVRQLRDVQAKVQQMELQARSQIRGGEQGDLGGPGDLPQAAGKEQSSKEVQDELLSANPSDFQADRPADMEEPFKLPQAVSKSKSAPAAQPPEPAEASKKGAAQRRQLRKDTASQSQALNDEAARQEAGRRAGVEPAPAKSKVADAEELLEQTRAPAGGPAAGGGQNAPADAKAAAGGRVSDGPVNFDLATDVPTSGLGQDQTTSWTAAGGLSLPMSLPEVGYKLTFSKSGGDARLALGLLPRASLETGLGLVWTVVWLLIALALIAALGRSDAVRALGRRLPLILIGAGLIWFLLLPAAPLGFVVFLVGAVTFGWQHRRA